MVERNTLLGHIVEIADYHSGKDRCKSKRVSEILKDNEKTPNKITFEAASYMKLQNNMGRSSYQNTRLLLKSQGHDVIPSWNSLRSYERDITPIIEESDKYVKINYEHGIQISCMQLLKLYELHNGPIHSSDFALLCTIKESVDGSGLHPIYNQRENIDTQNIIMAMFTILELKSEKDNKIIYKENKPNSPFSHRPIFLYLGKETRENLMILRKVVNERNNIELQYSEITFKIRVVGSFDGIDGKMRGLLTGLGGAYCCICTIDVDTASGMGEEGICSINNGFPINRCYEDTLKIWNDLSYENPIDGSTQILKKRKDYGSRIGVTNEPIIPEDVISVSPLHSILRGFDALLKIITHLHVGHYDWNEGAHISPTIKEARKILGYIISRDMSIKIDVPCQGGTSTNGVVLKNILGKEVGRNILTNFVPEKHRAEMSDIILRIWVIMRVFNSNNNVNINNLLFFCNETTVKLIENLNNSDNKKWIKLTPTLHGLLAHSAELISFNEGEGLGNKSEQGMENNNKF